MRHAVKAEEALQATAEGKLRKTSEVANYTHMQICLRSNGNLKFHSTELPARSLLKQALVSGPQTAGSAPQRQLAGERRTQACSATLSKPIKALQMQHVARADPTDFGIKDRALPPPPSAEERRVTAVPGRAQRPAPR
mmetsp:Transcript_17948/g.24095  ORF Transcript_17948/g.24095 Transcript_17948/m.24095 type:complete len:138 (-) Transcript_17948:27-440(-)